MKTQQKTGNEQNSTEAVCCMPCQATDPKELEKQIMSESVPKNEREWWAKRRIEELQNTGQVRARSWYGPRWFAFDG